MFKIMVLIKRREGMSMKHFIEYYENNHAPLAAGYLPHIQSYKRYYFSGLGSHVGEAPELPFDVCTELIFADEAGFEKAMEILADPEVSEKITTDEANLFDRSTITFMKVDERETDMSQYS